MRFTTTMACLAAITGVAFAGCGGNDQGGNAARYTGDNQKVAGVVDRLAEASRTSDGAEICDDLFTANLRASVQTASHSTCAAEVAAKIGAKNASFRIRSIEVKKGAAAAVVVDQARRASLVAFAKEGGDWRISRIGPATA